MAARGVENRKFSHWFTIQLALHLGLHHFRKQATCGCHNIGRRTDIQDAGQWAASNHVRHENATDKNAFLVH